MKIKDIRAMAASEIESKLSELKDKLFKQKFQKTLGRRKIPTKYGRPRGISPST